jgi:DNA invertase Pin-like site-specific DNA recombinase
MSTDIQLKGHSRQRQLERSANWVATHGVVLADRVHLEDIGVSAFKGANIKGGALGRFLEAAESDRIPAGSYLIVESLDRISRQEILQSLSVFLRIIAAGINLVTLQDGRVYGQNPKIEDLIISLTIMSRAHEESQLKSQRIAAAWANKRANAPQSKLTKWCPAWLRLNNNRSKYELIPERATIVRYIFQDTISGIGGLAIARRLNEKKIPVMGNSNGWHPSYIAKIVSNRAVVGEFQAYKTASNGKRKPDGSPIKNYFPSVVSEDLFYRAQKARTDRRVSGRGRKGKYLTNLFSGLAKCSYCHGPMVYENKGAGPKGGTFLVCDRAKRGLNCISTRWRYDHFEKSFLTCVHILDLPKFIGDQSSKLRDLDGAIEALEGEQLAVQEEMEKAYELIKLNSSLQFVADKLNSLQKRKDEIQRELKQKEEERQNLEAGEKDAYQGKNEIKSLIARLQNPTEGEDLYKLRSLVAARIKAVVKVLNVAVLGEAPRSQMLWRDMERMADGPEEVAEIGELKKAVVDSPYYGIGFGELRTLHVFPNMDDPYKFEHKIVDFTENYGPDEKLLPPPKPRVLNREG